MVEKEGSLTGNITSTRWYKLRGIQSALHVGFAAILEVENPAVLQKSAYQAAHANSMAQTPHVETQGASSAHDEIDLHPGLRSPMQRLDRK